MTWGEDRVMTMLLEELGVVEYLGNVLYFVLETCR